MSRPGPRHLRSRPRPAGASVAAVGKRLTYTAKRAGGVFDDWLVRRVVNRAGAHELQDPPPPEEPPVSADLLNLLRLLGVMLIGSGETTGRVQEILDDTARRYGANEVQFFVLPTGVFVRVEDSRGSAVDLQAAFTDTLRLDQIAALYRVLDNLKHELPSPVEVTEQLEDIIASKRPTAVWLMLLGNMVLTVGLGLMLNPTVHALAGYAVLGLVVQLLILLADRIPLLSLALPVTAGAVVTLLAFGFPHALGGGQPSELLIPAVASLLPGAMLTNGAIELATGSMVAGSSRTIAGLNKLLLLAFGIYIGLQFLGPQPPDVADTSQLGWWAPLLGVLLIGFGHSWRSSAPPKSLFWLLLVLYATYAAQRFGIQTGGALLGAFLGGLTAVPTAYLVQRNRNAPPTQVAFLPAFWMLVPGGMGLTAVSELVTSKGGNGLQVLVNVLLSVLAIALGVLVGSGLTNTRKPGTASMVDWLLPPADQHPAGQHATGQRAEGQRTTGRSEPGSTSQSSQCGTSESANSS
ncbi:threonine/serine ThrE exporter family protein [Nocardia huaxiensis]|uniref:threonine/serine ThrE exporter family protein n=1 Tax=Nocardia huaxiensis TaxID=2755382 RepID=UPI001E3C009D|nr:threonine/serine exporter family protein [Nocardia huaxiensis]UFS94491.1 threonine/serine exporter family protein [Nocardia huaxiensis]